jgi:hypothetical protein
LGTPIAAGLVSTTSRRTPVSIPELIVSGALGDPNPRLKGEEEWIKSRKFRGKLESRHSRACPAIHVFLASTS